MPAAREFILREKLNEFFPGDLKDIGIIVQGGLYNGTMRALERHDDVVEGEGWAVRLHGVDEALAVSRRQLSAVKAAIAAV